VCFFWKGNPEMTMFPYDVKVTDVIVSREHYAYGCG
jgi:hypothetical protein